MSDRPTGSSPRDDLEDELERRLRDHLADRGRATSGDLQALRDDIARLPGRSAGRRTSLLAAAAAIVVLVAAGSLISGRFLGLTGRAPTGEAAFAGDPRLEMCRPSVSGVAQVFEMTHARWFPLYFPGWFLGAPELEVDDPALVVIGQSRPGQNFVPQPSGAEPPRGTGSPTFDLCIAVGPPATAVAHQYGPTWFERIVPVLSAEDIARADRLDPDVARRPGALVRTRATRTLRRPERQRPVRVRGFAAPRLRPPRSERRRPARAGA